MATCKHCGKWCGFFDDEHLDCADDVVQGRTPGLLINTAVPIPLSGVTIFWSVFGALWAFSLSAGLVVSLVRAILR